MELELSTILTAGGAVAAAGLITGLVELLKRLPYAGPLIKGQNLEQLLAFFFSAVLVVVAFVATVVDKNVGAFFMAFLAWYGIARLSMAAYDDIVQNPGSIGNG